MRPLGAVPRPLPFTTKSESAEAAIAVGYHAVGMRPASASVPMAVGTPLSLADRSKTATAFASLSATKSRVPPGESASADGVLPSPGPDGGGSRSSPSTVRALVSTTVTRSVLAEATKSRDWSRLSSIADGWRPTVSRVPASSRFE